MQVLIRRARSDDRPAVERICAHTWDWGDYVPEVWDDWLAEGGRGEGHALVGEVDGLVVALGKVTLQTRDQVWLEGMRVDPDYRQRGIAGQFLAHSLAYAQDLGAQVVRLGTGNQNVAIHKIMSRAGMRQVGSYGLRQAEPLPGGPKAFFLTSEYAERMEVFLAANPVIAHTSGLYSVDWVWQALSPESVAQFLARGSIAAQLGPDGALVALATIHPNQEEGEMWVGFAAGQAAAITSLATAIRAHAARIGMNLVQVMLPDLAWLRNAFHAAGYVCGEWDGELWIFEHWLGQSSPAGSSAEPAVSMVEGTVSSQASLHPKALGKRSDGGNRGR